MISSVSSPTNGNEKQISLSFFALLLPAILASLSVVLLFTGLRHFFPLLLIVLAVLELRYPNSALSFLYFGAFAFQKHFTVLGVRFWTVDFYVGELVIAFYALLWLIGILFRKRSLCLPPRLPLFIPFLGLGFVLAFLGFLNYGSFAARQASFVFYPLLALITAQKIRNPKEAQTLTMYLFVALLAGLLFHLMFGFMQIPLIYKEAEISYAGPLSVALFLCAGRQIKPTARKLSWPLLFIPALYSIYYFRLSSMVAYMLLLVVLIIVSLLESKSFRAKLLGFCKAALTTALLVSAAILICQLFASERLGKIGTEAEAVFDAVSGHVVTNQQILQHGVVKNGGARISDPTQMQQMNIKIRFLYWKSAIKQGMESPILGIGFGKKLEIEEFEDVEEQRRFNRQAHNSYLTVFLHMGITGLALFLLILLPVAAKAFVQIARLSGRDRDLLTAVFLSWLVMAALAFFNVVLSTPTGAILFWSLFGLTISVSHYLGKGKEVV